ncbi:MAG: FmdB family transcriptional regulator [Actinomycetaceae bacterium]|nr:FmdB family transcriptional regulator [Actinomycetaceae bacterium]
MPTYTYRCKECEYQFDIKQSFSDAPIELCSECGGKLRKVFSPVGVVFKGSGFYRTDTKNNGTITSSSTPSASSSTQKASASPSSSSESPSSSPVSTPSSSPSDN